MLAYTPAQIADGEGLRMLLTVKDLERLSQISRYTWRAWIAQGKLPVIRAGRRVRIEEEAFREFLRKCRVPARDEAGQ
jgi:excisionase family DNA binding protein